mmetsp:Transcript_36647/g.105462  ORF Transcript_36647/g.105462 Transcript_36647/m.105462 type:complete len:280 (+) Transcript_36647:335-1174(+)
MACLRYHALEKRRRCKGRPCGPLSWQVRAGRGERQHPGAGRRTQERQDQAGEIPPEGLGAERGEVEAVRVPELRPRAVHELPGVDDATNAPRGRPTEPPEGVDHPLAHRLEGRGLGGHGRRRQRNARDAPVVASGVELAETLPDGSGRSTRAHVVGASHNDGEVEGPMLVQHPREPLAAKPHDVHQLLAAEALRHIVGPHSAKPAGEDLATRAPCGAQDADALREGTGVGLEVAAATAVAHRHAVAVTEDAHRLPLVRRSAAVVCDRHPPERRPRRAEG